MSEDSHNPDGSPPSSASAEARAEYWERRAKAERAFAERFVGVMKEFNEAAEYLLQTGEGDEYYYTIFSRLIAEYEART